MIKTYLEMSSLTTFEERYRYLQLNGIVGEEIFGFDRFLNQKFYKSSEWKTIRDFVIMRDNGRDLGVDGYEIREKILIHHMNPIILKDIVNRSEFLLNPKYLISTSQSTHNAIHYGDFSLLAKTPIERSVNDTCPWKHEQNKETDHG